MNDLQIRYFIAVAKNLSFTKAANDLYVTQPAISHQIANLEKEFDITLFDRTNKGIILTAGGELLYNFFTNYKQQFNDVIIKAKYLNGNEISKIRLGCVEGWNVTSFFPKLLNIFETDYPKVTLSMECYSCKELISALLDKDIDAIVTLGDTLNNIPEIHSDLLCESEQILIYSKFHHLTSIDNPKPVNFRDEYFYTIVSSEVSHAKSFLISYCKPYGFKPKIKTVRNFDSVFTCVQNGMGVAIVDSLVKVKDHKDFLYLKLDNTFSINFAYRIDDTNKNLHNLKNELKVILSE